MCRYAQKSYKSHFACFTCRKSFKQPPIRDWLTLHGLEHAYDKLLDVWAHKDKLRARESELGVTYESLVEKYSAAAHRCPQCSGQMIDMGMDFKAPRQQNKKAWRILQGMFRVGHCFHTCGCLGPGWVPTATSEYRQYLEGQRRGYLARLQDLPRATIRESTEDDEARAHWASLIRAIDKEIKSLS